MQQRQPRLHAPPRGLRSAEIDDIRAIAGWNELAQRKTVSPIRVLLRQFAGLLVLILIGAAFVALVLGEYVDAAAIWMVVLLNGVLGFVQEWRAERAIDALRNMLSPSAHVVRDGIEQVIPAREIVPGDLAVLSAGDRVPADIELLSGIQLKVDESVLTGESVPVVKDAAGSANRLFMGTAIVSGRAEGRVLAIGAATEFGQIADLTQSAGEKVTHLQRQLTRLARQMGLAALAIAAVISTLGLAMGRGALEMFMTGLSLAVAVVPEGLPAVVTITLALGASAMTRKKALARRLQAVETLGAASVICTDKTGTLTENKMTAARIWTGGAQYDVTGTGYDPEGHIERDGQNVRAADDPDLRALLSVALICNHAKLNRTGDAWNLVGEPTEGALVTLAYKGWCDISEPAEILHEHPFSSDRKRMSVLVRDGGELVLMAKGAPEQIVSASVSVRRNGRDAPMDEGARDEIRDAFQRMASNGLRVIALAMRPASDQGDTAEERLSFLGLVGIIDPPRPEVAGAIAATRAAGIRVIMITGDNAETAAAIAKSLGLDVELTMTGRDLAELDDAALSDVLRKNVLFARTSPAHKMRLVELLQAQGQIVVMTGDGVNDAPALKRADIGVAMGLRGTDVAKDASDLILLDDNFATIVRAIREGRRQFDNVRKFVRYLLSSNAGEVIAIVVNIAVGGPLIFLATQILWMNLITDGVTAVSLGLEKSETDQMTRPPRKKSEPILGRPGLLMILAFGTYTASASLWIFYSLLAEGEGLARTVAFSGMIVFEKMSVFAFRSFTQPVSRIGWASNPYLLLALAATLLTQLAAVYFPPLQLLLRTEAMAWEHWGIIALLATPLIVVPELIKMFRGRASRPVAAA